MVDSADIPFISVIVVAHDRHEYVMEALNSVLNQTIGPMEYEVIVVKNFRDEVIDDFIENKGFRHILTNENPVGSKLYQGIKVAKGEIVCILEDDDAYLPDRLEHIKSIFSNNQSVYYYHNAELIMLRDGTKLNKGIYKPLPAPIIYSKSDEILASIRNIISSNGAGNPSCIAFRRITMDGKLEHLKHIERSPDTFLFYASLYHDKSIYLDNLALTYLRQHVQSTSRTVGNFKDTVAKRDLFIEKALNDRLRLYEVVSDPLIKKNFWDILAWSKIEALFRSNETKRRPMFDQGLKYLKSKHGRSVKIPFFFILLYILYAISPTLSKSIFAVEEWLRAKREWDRMFPA